MGDRRFLRAAPLLCGAWLALPALAAAQAPAAPTAPAPPTAAAEAFHPVVEGRSALAPRRSPPKAAEIALPAPAPRLPVAPPPVPAAPPAAEGPSALTWFGVFCIALSLVLLLVGVFGRGWGDWAARMVDRTAAAMKDLSWDRPWRGGAATPEAPSAAETEKTPSEPPRRLLESRAGRAMTPIRINDLLAELSPAARAEAVDEAPALSEEETQDAPFAPSPYASLRRRRRIARRAEEAARGARLAARRTDEARWEAERQDEELARRSAELARRIQRFSQTPAGRRR